VCVCRGLIQTQMHAHIIACTCTLSEQCSVWWAHFSVSVAVAVSVSVSVSVFVFASAPVSVFVSVSVCLCLSICLFNCVRAFV